MKISEERFFLECNVKIGWLTYYYMEKLGLDVVSAYRYVYASGIVPILKNIDTGLYLESVYIIRDAIDIRYADGDDGMKEFLRRNISFGG